MSDQPTGVNSGTPVADLAAPNPVAPDMATPDAATDPAPVDSFGIALPAEWIRFPLESGDFESFVRGQRERLAVETELNRTAQRQFELLMRQLRNDCQRSNVTLAATLLAPIEEVVGDDAGGVANDDDHGAGLLSATCTISSMSKAGMGTDLPLTVNTIAAAMGREPAKDDEVEVVNLDAPAIVEIPVGPAVKLVRLHTFPPHPETRQRLAVFAQHFLVPYDQGKRAAVVTFSTPVPAYAKPLSELFDQMMLTFRMFAGDDPTDPVA